LVIGRSSAGEGALGGDPELSRRHARLYRDATGALVIEDLGSTNGTWVNGQRAAAAVRLAPGDTLRIGRTTFQVAAATPAGPPAPPAPTPQRTAVPPPPPPAQPPSPQGAQPVLRVLEGPLSGSSIPIGRSLLIGRSFGGDGSLGGEPKLSRKHARFVAAPGGMVFVEDTGSTNGTYVNDRLVRGSQALRDGDFIRLGGSRMQLTGAGAGAPLAQALPTGPAPAGTAPVLPPPPPPGAVPVALPGAPFAPYAYAPRGAAGTRRRSGTIIAVFAGVLGLVVAASIVAIALLAPSGPRKCPPTQLCGGPPSGPALSTLTHYRTPSFSLGYDGKFLEVKNKSSNGIELAASGEFGNMDMTVDAVPAGTSPDAATQKKIDSLGSQVVGLTEDTAPEHAVFEPTVGFRKGAGGAFAGTVDTPQGAGAPLTVAVESATDGRMTITVAVETDAADESGRDTALDLASTVITTIRFPSDPDR
ncbi:MAG: hypothetical protein QOJ07_2120, partial [Thermoleophilaceae bacterium]|nr:hypothetical protein [Thermoleophilaceae bacterium]